eukprot:4846428-Pleurochrysis_carterae.AAC.1
MDDGAFMYDRKAFCGLHVLAQTKKAQNSELHVGGGAEGEGKGEAYSSFSAGKFVKLFSIVFSVCVRVHESSVYAANVPCACSCLPGTGCPKDSGGRSPASGCSCFQRGR